MTTALVPPPRDSVDTDSWDLVAAAQAGNSAAFGQLYERYVDAVFRFVFYRVRDRSLAEDLTSETFCRALAKLSSVSYQGRDVGAWFVTIARNLVIDHIKSSRTKLDRPTANVLDWSDGQTPDRALIDQDTAQQVLACVERLAEDQRTAVTLQHLHGLPVSAVAELMGKREGAVKALTHRGRMKLAGMPEMVGLR